MGRDRRWVIACIQHLLLDRHLKIPPHKAGVSFPVWRQAHSSEGDYVSCLSPSLYGCRAFSNVPPRGAGAEAGQSCNSPRGADEHAPAHLVPCRMRFVCICGPPAAIRHLGMCYRHSEYMSSSRKQTACCASGIPRQPVLVGGGRFQADICGTTGK